MKSLVVIGTIGAGKSTAVQFIHEYLTSLGIESVIVPEDVPPEVIDPYIRALEDGTAEMLDLLAWRVQVGVIIRRMNNYLRLRKEYPNAILLFDRSPADDCVFVETQRSMGIMSEWTAAEYYRFVGSYLQLFKETPEIFYLRVRPETNHARILKRSDELTERDVEKQYPHTYLEALRQAHEEYVHGKNVQIIEYDHVGPKALIPFIDRFLESP